MSDFEDTNPSASTALTLADVRRVTQLVFVRVMISEIVMPNRWARRHSAAQIAKIMASITKFGVVNPIIIDTNNMLVAGEARLQAVRQLGYTEVPAIRVGHLSNAEIQAYRIADNKLADGATWDPDVLRDEVAHLLTLDFDPQVLGIDFPELDQILKPPIPETAGDEPALAPSVSFLRLGDLFSFGRHRLLCGDALIAEHGQQLMGGDLAVMSTNDFPYNVKIRGHVSKRRGPNGPREFAQASGELAPDEFREFLASALSRIKARCAPGAIIQGYMDWRSIHQLIHAAESNDLEYLNLAVWKKHTAGLGSYLRSQHELVAILKAPGAAHYNAVQLGTNGRHRTNVWEYDGRAGFGRGRKEELDRHPTPKPVAMIADSILDCTRRGDIVLDMFAGGGTTAIACERIGRTARLMEIDPIYCEASLVRFRDAFGEDPVHVETGLTLTELIARRTEEAAASSSSMEGQDDE